MTEWQGELLAALIPVLATALTALFAMLAKRLDAWLASKIENENVERMTRRLNTVIWDVVLELQQTQVDELKAATDPASPGGRKITPVEAERLRKTALDNVKGYLGPKGLEKLKQVFDLDANSLDDYLGTAIESTVRTNKDAFTRSALEGGKPGTRVFGELLTTEKEGS